MQNDYTALIAAELRKGAAIYENETLYTINGHSRTFGIVTFLMLRAADALEAVSAPAPESVTPTPTDLEVFVNHPWARRDLAAARGVWGGAFRSNPVLLAAMLASAPVSDNTLRERIAYALGDVSARCHVELGRNPLMLELADAVLALLDKKEVK